MQLSLYISDLLFDHDCVTVPGFGSFLGNYKSAEYDFKEQKFYPPSKQISFNSQIRDNDGLLAKHLSKKLDLSYDDAVKKIHHIVLSWSQKIKSETIVLKNLGEFYLNQEGNITFVPSNRVNHLKESFGLPPVFVTELSGKKSYNSKQTIPTYFKPEKRTNNFFKQAAVWALLVVGLGSAIYINEKNNILEQQIAYEQEVREQSIQKVQKAVFNFGSLPSLTVNVKMKDKKYFIIAGAFRISKNAENLVLNLKRKGYDASRLALNEKGLNPVAFTSFSKRNEAVTELRIIQKKENKDAWIFESK
jgi:nucleoid DNA-binding protein